MDSLIGNRLLYSFSDLDKYLLLGRGSHPLTISLEYPKIPHSVLAFFYLQDLGYPKI